MMNNLFKKPKKKFQKICIYADQKNLVNVLAYSSIKKYNNFNIAIKIILCKKFDIIPLIFL